MIILFLCISSTASAQLKADFSASVTQGCEPVTVQFTDLSAGSITEWFWDFGNGTTSYAQNPVVTYLNHGSYNVRLIIRNANDQAYEEKKGFIKVYAVPEVKFNILNGDSGCAPVQTNFMDVSGIDTAVAKNWLWNFGNGDTSHQQNPSALYSLPGKYDVSLTVQTVNGCLASTGQRNAVKVGVKPTASFSAAPLKGCASTLRNFKNTSTGGVTGSLWYFGDGGTSLEKQPKYHYEDTGFFTVKLLAYNNGCADSAIRTNYIHVDGPVAKFNTRVDCSNRVSLMFTNTSIDEKTLFWNFGDGQTSVQNRITHVYAKPGVYMVKLMVTGNSCNDTAYDTLHIKTGNTSIKLKPQKQFYCKNDSLQLTISGYDTAVATSFAWNFADGFTAGFKSNGIVVGHAYTTNGSFNPVAYIRDENRCIDSTKLVQPIIIKGPTAEFGNSPYSCTDSAVTFIDKSISDVNIPINEWFWSFGDGITTTGQNLQDYSYIFPGLYTINLKVTDSNGCTDSIAHTINIGKTPVVDAGNDTLLCEGIKFALNPSGAISYTWNSNPDLSCTACTNPVINPTKPAIYIVTGSNYGCTASDSIQINVQPKEKVTVQQSDINLCKGDSLKLSVSGADRYTWNPSSSLSNGTSPNPTAFPSQTTTYTIIGKDNNNCFADTAIINVGVYNKPVVDIKDSLVELITGSRYTILANTSNDAQYLQWSPPSKLSCFNCLQPSTNVYNNITYTLRATNTYGCSDSDKITLIALCTGESVFIPNTFSPNNDGMNDHFFPRSLGDPLVRSLTVFNRLGQVVFQKKDVHANNPNDGWDGTSKNKIQPTDVYTYVIELQCSANKPILLTGSVTLLR